MSTNIYATEGAAIFNNRQQILGFPKLYCPKNHILNLLYVIMAINRVEIIIFIRLNVDMIFRR